MLFIFPWHIIFSWQGTTTITEAVVKVMVDHGVKNGSVVNLHANFLGKVREIYMM